MLKLIDSEKFKTEYKKYQNAIERINHPEAKDKGLSLLKKLKKECMIIDQAHGYENKNIDPRSVKENIDRLVNIRRDINKLIKDSKDL